MRQASRTREVSLNKKSPCRRLKRWVPRRIHVLPVSRDGSCGDVWNWSCRLQIWMACHCVLETGTYGGITPRGHPRPFFFGGVPAQKTPLGRSAKPKKAGTCFIVWAPAQIKPLDRPAWPKMRKRGDESWECCALVQSLFVVFSVVQSFLSFAVCHDTTTTSLHGHRSLTCTERRKSGPWDNCGPRQSLIRQTQAKDLSAKTGTVRQKKRSRWERLMPKQRERQRERGREGESDRERERERERVREWETERVEGKGVGEGTLRQRRRTCGWVFRGAGSRGKHAARFVGIDVCATALAF